MFAFLHKFIPQQGGLHLRICCRRVFWRAHTIRQQHSARNTTATTTTTEKKTHTKSIYKCYFDSVFFSRWIFVVCRCWCVHGAPSFTSTHFHCRSKYMSWNKNKRIIIILLLLHTPFSRSTATIIVNNEENVNHKIFIYYFTDIFSFSSAPFFSSPPLHSTHSLFGAKKRNVNAPHFVQYAYAFLQLPPSVYESHEPCSV